MPLTSLFPPDVLNLLVLAFGAGLLTQLARQLAGLRVPRARRVLACGVLGGVAALSVVALLSAARPPAPPPALLLAAACVGGWSGPRLLGRLGRVIERRLGLRQSPIERCTVPFTPSRAVERPQGRCSDQEASRKKIRVSRHGSASGTVPDGPDPDGWPLEERGVDDLDHPNATDATAAPQGRQAQ